MKHLESTFETATLPYLDSLYRTAFRMVQDQAAAEKYVERAYIEAGKSFHRAPSAGGPRVWLFASLFRILHGRRSAWPFVKCWLTESMHNKTIRVADPDEILVTLNAISTILREVVLLADVEEFNRSEIATILGIPEELVLARLAEARARLRAGLAFRREVPPLLEGSATA